MRGGVHERNHAAHGMADQRKLAQVQFFYGRSQIRSVILVRIHRWLRPSAVPMTALVESEHVVITIELPGHKIEPMRVRGTPVQAKNGRAARRTVVETVQPQTAGIDKPACVRSGPRDPSAKVTARCGVERRNHWNLPVAVLSLGCNGQAANVVFLDRPRDQTGCLDVLHEFMQIFRPGDAALRCSDRLLDGGKAALENS